MTKLTQEQRRLERIRELFFRLKHAAQAKRQEGLTTDEYDHIIAQFKMDTGLSFWALVDYQSVLMSIGAITHRWVDTKPEIYEDKNAINFYSVNREMRYFVDVLFALPERVQEP